MNETQQNVFGILEAELQDDPSYSADILNGKIANAIRELKMRRCYPASYSDTDIDGDIGNYFSTILNVARYDYNQRGVEGESTHTEKGISRQYADREKLWYGVHAFVKVFA